MATDVILPALGMSQDSGKIVRWLKAEGEEVAQGEPLVEIETDKATVEIEAPAHGFLARVVANVGAEVPVGQVIATVLAPGEVAPALEPRSRNEVGDGESRSAHSVRARETRTDGAAAQNDGTRPTAIATSLLASRIAADHQVDLSRIKVAGPRVRKTDVLAYLQNHQQTPPLNRRQVAASPKARRLAREQGRDLAAIRGSGPLGAVLAADVLAPPDSQNPELFNVSTTFTNEAHNQDISTIWRIMAERTAQSWTSVPHFYLVREVDASRLIAWRNHLLLHQEIADITYTDLLAKIVATALRLHPRLNSTWSAGRITLLPEIHLGLAVAVEEGLVVPVLHRADTLGLRELTRQRKELIAKARSGKLRPQDISGGTFTISNLGMYGVDAFNAIINEPQAAILAVGRIIERVVAVNGEPAVRPMLTLTLSCDHRAVDGARGAQFLDTLAHLIEEPLGLLLEAEVER